MDVQPLTEQEPGIPPGTVPSATPRQVPGATGSSTDAGRSQDPDSGRKDRIGWVVAGSMVVGLVASLLFAAGPVVAPSAAQVGGAVLAGFALGWATLLMLSVRFTDQPQRWAAAPALLMGSSGVLIMTLGSAAGAALGWILPPAVLVVAAWMVVQSRRHLRSRTRRWLVSPVIAVMAVGAVGAGYETVSEATDTDVTMPGRLIDVGRHRLHLNCTGNGSPTVVLQAGGGMMSSDFGWIAPEVARETSVCVYDRAGRGWSDPVITRQDADQIATDLHTLLQRANVPSPYILAGHSFGGLYALTAADRYPDEVAALVLIDTTHPTSTPVRGSGSPTSPDADPAVYSLTSHITAVASTSARLGLGRLFAHTESTLPSQSTAEVNMSLTTARHLRSTLDEYAAARWSTPQAGALADFGDKPLMVLSANVAGDPSWVQGHAELAGLSTNSVHRVIDGAAHATLVTVQEHAAATTQAILDVVASVRSRKPLEQ
jgi:pimeloyl-ACP methyl ester carboxylesterase